MGRTRRGQRGPWSARHGGRARSCSSKAPRAAAAAVHVVRGTWWRGCWGHRRLKECRWRSEALVPSARCGGGERRAGGGGHRRATQAQGPPGTGRRAEAAGGIAGCRNAGGQGRRLCRVRDAAAAASGGPAAEDIGAPPKHKGLRALSVASRAYLLRRQQGDDPRRHIEDLGEFKVAGDLDVWF